MRREVGLQRTELLEAGNGSGTGLRHGPHVVTTDTVLDGAGLPHVTEKGEHGVRTHLEKKGNIIIIFTVSGLEV